jgi:hypothetical protein
MTGLILWLVMVNGIRDGWPSLMLQLVMAKSIKGGWPC